MEEIMKLVNPKFEILEQEPGLDGIYKQIELAGRTCYHSQDKITEDSSKKFVDMLINRGHTAVLEQGTIYLKIPVTHWGYLHYSGEHPDLDFDYYPDHSCWEKYSKMKIVDEVAYVATNYRVLYERGWLDDLKYLCEPTEHHAKRVTVKVNCSIGISREWNRHRKFSVCEQSTRYCNYSKDRFGSELTFITPSWVKEKMYKEEAARYVAFRGSCQEAETYYMMMIKAGATPQQARDVLPLATATEVVYTGFIEDWQHFFFLRCDNAAHPDMRALAIPLKEEFIKRGLI